MKEQKRTLFFLSFIAIASLSFSIAIHFGCGVLSLIKQSDSEFVKNILIGIFTGAFLSVIIAKINYTAEKEKFIAEFQNLCEDFCVALKKIPYLYFEADAKLWAAYYNEIENAKFSIAKSSENTTSVPYNALLNWYRDNSSGKAAGAMVERRKKEIEQEMPLVITAYYEFCGFNISAFDRLLEKRGFCVPGNKKEKAIIDAHKTIKGIYTFILSTVEYMSDFSTTNNLIVKINDLQMKIFEVPNRVGSITLLPPRNQEVENILNCLSNKKGGVKENDKPET